MVKYFIPYWGFWLLFRDEEGFTPFGAVAVVWQSSLLALAVVVTIIILTG